MSEEIKMKAQASSLARIGSSLLDGLRVVVKWIIPPNAQLGFTGADTPPVINVAWDNEEYMSDMSDDEKTFFRMGVFAHEILHQIFTNFRYSNKIIDSLSQAEAAIFMKFANTLEDPAIEYFAKNVLGGKLLKALKYSIAVIYQKSPSIDESGDAFSQMLNALIHFGDCGIVKGNFTFPDAEEYFAKVAPLYNKGITCADSRKRLDIAKECMEITKPLWKEYVKNEEAWEQLLNELLEYLKKHGVPMANEDDLKGDKKSSKDTARGITMKGLKCDDCEKTDVEDGEESDSSSSNDSESSDSDSGSNSEKKDDNNDEGSSSSKNSSEETENEASGKSSPSENPIDNEVSSEEILAEDLFIDDEMMASINKTIEAEKKEILNEKEKECNAGKIADGLPSFDIESKYFKKASCLNRRVKNVSSSMKENYNEMVTSFGWDIKTLTKALQKIFSSDKEETIRATSGSYNIKRGSLGCTARIMDKRREPSNKKDACVLLCVDLSGSMNGYDKIGQARKASIVFAEALRKLGIPHYIMGFQADCGAQAVHNHFVTWDGSGRETLATMTANNNNFDGYSIRYAGNLIKSRPESNKFIFIISDGEPACYTYTSYDEGNCDTKEAVKELRKFCNVYGIALGYGCDPLVLQEFYGKDFIHCSDASLLTNTLAKKITKTFKGRD